jgi:SAM-dependent methyltransferase
MRRPAVPDTIPAEAARPNRAGALFDAKAAAWPAKYAPGGALTGRLTRLSGELRERARKGDHVLDLGCATGQLARSAAASGLRVTGCDIAPEMLRLAADADDGRTVNWVRLEPDWRSLPFPEGTFAAVVASSVLEYTGDVRAVLDECARVLRPGGILLATVPDIRHPVRWAEWLVRPAALGALTLGADGGRIAGYCTYLRLSGHRHRTDWWYAAGRRAGLVPVPRPRERASLRLLEFRRPPGQRAIP